MKVDRGLGGGDDNRGWNIEVSGGKMRERNRSGWEWRNRDNYGGRSRK